MSVSGTWNVSMSTPMGAQTGQLELAEDNGALTGTMSNQGASLPLVDGTCAGDHVAFKAKVTTPMPLTLEFAGDVSGDEISGTVQFGGFGSGTWSGTRA